MGINDIKKYKKLILCVLLWLIICLCIIWNFPIHNYNIEDFSNKNIVPLELNKNEIALQTKYLEKLGNERKDKDYKEILLDKIISIQTDKGDRQKYIKELLALDINHNPDIIYFIIEDYKKQGKYDEALQIAKNIKLAKNRCYKESKFLGQAISCNINMPFINFTRDWYSNWISCNFTKSACYDYPIYQQYKYNNKIKRNYNFNRKNLIELVEK